MANQLSARPWALDTPSATPLWSTPLNIGNIEFINYTNEQDCAQILDKNGNVVWVANGADDFSPVRSGPIGWIEGLILDYIDSGVLLIYFK